MYNLNVNVNPSPTAAAGLLGVAAAEVTPRTPEIVNSLIAMTNPFEGYTNERSRDRTDSTSSGEPSPPSVQHTCSQLIKEGTHPVVALIISYRVLSSASCSSSSLPLGSSRDTFKVVRDLAADSGFLGASGRGIL